MDSLQEVVEREFEGKGTFDQVVFMGLYSRLHENGIKDGFLCYGDYDLKTVEDDDKKRIVQVKFSKEVTIRDSTLNSDPFLNDIEITRFKDFIPFDPKAGALNYFLDPDSGRQYLRTVSGRNLDSNYDSEVVITYKRLKQGVDIKEIWEDKPKLVINPDVVDAELTLAYKVMPTGGVEKTSMGYYKGGEDFGYYQKDILWKAKITPKGDIKEDRFFKLVNQVWVEGIEQHKEYMREYPGTLDQMVHA